MLISLLIPFLVTYKANVMTTILDKYSNSKNIYLSIYREKEDIKLNLEYIINLINTTSNFSLNRKTRNLKLSNRKRDYLQSTVLISISNLKNIKEDLNNVYCNNENINASICSLNQSINNIVREEKKIMEDRLNNIDLENLKGKVDITIKRIENLEKELNKFYNYIELLRLDINKKIKIAYHKYNFLKFLPYWIIVILGFFSDNKFSDITCVIFIYVLILKYINKTIFCTLSKYDLD